MSQVYVGIIALFLAQSPSLLQQQPNLTSPRRPAGISSSVFTATSLLAALRHMNQGPKKFLFCF